MRAAPRLRRLEVVGLGLLSYIPFLLSSPGNVSADTKPYLYLDPGRLLARSAYLWSDHLGTGTVPHQAIGYLFPMGPYYWGMDQLGVPDWVAQRLWMGSISFAAALGALWLLTMLGTRRSGALVGALVYMLTPYQLALTARISVLLLPWAALPWLVGLAARALDRRGWRDPALFALVALVAGTINASSFLLVGIAPLLWLVVAVVQRRASIRAAMATAGRIALLTFGVSLWWAVGLALQSRYGFSVLDATETLARVSDATLPADLLRGFGNWFLSGSDRLGPWLVQAADYRADKLLSAATLAVPVAGLVAAACLRWRHRAYFIVLVFAGVLVGVGAWPYDHPSAVGSVFKSLANGSALGLALRNTPRVVPVIVLGLAGLLAAGVGAITRRSGFRVVVAGVVVGCVVVGFAPVWRHGYLSDGVERPEDVPQYWHDAAAALDAEGDATRVLEIPGSLFSAYRWGNTVEPVTPGLTDRPYVARELLAYGTPASVNLLAALDRRIQEGTLDPNALAPVARLLRVGTIVLRSDLQYERYDTPRPRVLWNWLTDPVPPGIGAPVAVGPTTPNRPTPALPLFDALELGSTGSPWPPAVALFPVRHRVPIIDVQPAAEPVVLSGDGDGIVEAAAAGLLDGHELVQYAVTLDDRALRTALGRDASLVVTDSARRRARRWDLLKDDVGATERAGQRPLVEDTEDHRLDQIPGMTDADRTVVEQRGARVDATAYGNGEGYRPEDRPAAAFDGDLATAWRVPPGTADARLVVRPETPVRTDRVTIVQATGAGDPDVTAIRLTFDGDESLVVDLDDRSRTAEGQEVRFPRRTVHTLGIELLPADGGSTTGGGLAEVRLGGIRVRELVRVPTRMLFRAGAAGQARPLAVVLARQRQLPASGRSDPEANLARVLKLPRARTFSLRGTVRPSASATDDLLDSVLGTTGPATFTSSGRLAGLPSARSSRAFDDDPTTHWSAPFGVQEGQWLDARLASPTNVGGEISLTVVADGRHSVPTRLRIEADGAPVASIDLPEIRDDAREGSTATVPFSFDPVMAADLRVVVESVRTVTATDGTVAPVTVADVAVPGIGTVRDPATVPSTCRDDLLSIDGRPVAVEVTGAPQDDARGLTVMSCDGPTALVAGRNVIIGTSGATTGFDLDRLVLTSDEGGGAAQPPRLSGTARPTAGATVSVLASGPTSFDLRIRTDGQPFWLVLGQSLSDGWHARSAAGPSLGAPELVDGFANGWLVQPTAAGTMSVELRWTPQRFVWWGLGLSVVAILACLVLLVVTRRRRQASSGLGDPPALSWPLRFAGAMPGARSTVVSALALGASAAVVSRPEIGVGVGVAAVLACRVVVGRAALTVGAPLMLVAAKAFDAPELGWVAILLLGADLVVGHLWGTSTGGSPTVDGAVEDRPRTSG